MSVVGPRTTRGHDRGGEHRSLRIPATRVADDLATLGGPTARVPRCTRRRSLALRPRTSRRSSIARRARWSVSRSKTRPATSATTSPAASRCSRPPARSASIAWSSRRPPRSTASPTSTPITEDAPLRPINPYGETKRAFEGALPGTAGPTACAASPSATSTSPARPSAIGEVHDPETHLIPTVFGAIEAGRPVTLFGDDYPTPDGTCDPRLHPRRRPRRRAPAGDRGDGRATTSAPHGAPSSATSGNGGGFSNLEVLAAAERVVGQRDPARDRPAASGRPAGPRRVGGSGRGDPRLAAAPAQPRRDRRLGLGLAPAPPRRYSD